MRFLLAFMAVTLVLNLAPGFSVAGPTPGPNGLRRTQDDLVSDVQQLLENGDLRDASTLVSERLEGDTPPSSRAVHQARRQIAQAFARINNPREAWEEFRRLAEFESENLDDEASIAQVAGTLGGLVQLSIRAKRQDETEKLCDKIEAQLRVFSADAPTSDYREALANVRAVKSQMLIAYDRPDEATALWRKEYEAYQSIFEANSGNETVTQIWLRTLMNLMARSDDPAFRDELFSEHQRVVTERREAAPDNLSFAVQYVAAIQAYVTGAVSRDPQRSLELIEEARDILKELLEKDGNLIRTLRPYAVRLSQIELIARGQVKIQELTGAEAAPLDSDAWINGEPVAADEQFRAPTLIAFWALSSPQATRALELAETLRKRIGEDKVQVFGVTRHMQLRWNYDKGEPEPGGDMVDPEEENDALELYLKKREIDWPTVVIDDMQVLFEDYGVTGLPHIVLTDAEGKIRMIRVGVNDAFEAELESAIKEILEAMDQD